MVAAAGLEFTAISTGRRRGDRGRRLGRAETERQHPSYWSRIIFTVSDPVLLLASPLEAVPFFARHVVPSARALICDEGLMV